MKLIDRYVGKSYLLFFMLVILVPGLLFSLFELISQLDDVGKGSYQMVDALIYVGLTAPRRFIEIIPITALLAGVITLGRFADTGELIAMQTCGFSFMAIGRGIVLGTLLIAAAAAALDELAVPGLEQKAAMIHMKTSSRQGITYTGKGIWIRQGGSFINVEKLIGLTSAEGITIYRFSADGRLEHFIHASSAEIRPGGWILHDVTLKEISGFRFATSHRSTLAIDPVLRAKEMKALELPPEGLSALELWRYTKALKRSGQNPDHYLLAFWRKFSQPLTALGMALVAIAFMSGQAERGTMGGRIALSVVAGLILYFLDQVTMQVGLLWGIRPAAVAFAPSAVAWLAAISRFRWSAA